MMKIIHLSDLHVRKNNDKKDSKNAIALAQHVKDQHESAPGIETLVVITGDLVHSTSDDHYTCLQQEVLTHLIPTFRCLIVPGNHDYSKVGCRLDPAGPGRFRELLKAAEYPTDYPTVYPQLEEVPAGRAKVRFIGVDTGDKRDKAPLANGIIDDDQLKKLGGFLRRCAREFVVVYLHHHPIYHKSLFTGFRESEDFCKVVKNRANLILFGHKHNRQSFYDRKGVPLMLASGKVSKPEGDALVYRVIELDTEADGFGKGRNGVRFYAQETPADASTLKKA